MVNVSASRSVTMRATTSTIASLSARQSRPGVPGLDCLVPPSARSSGDRARASGARGRRFDSCRAHRRESPSESPSPPRLSDPPTTEPQQTILVCDDEASLRELVRVVLGDGYRFVEAEDGEQALELARKQRPDLIVLDVMLPRLNGLEVLAELRRDAALQDVPVVIVTAWSHAESLAVSSGADRFVAKPFDPDELKRPVEELLAR